MLINCDLGEGFGAWQMAPDLELLPHIHLANLACGFHAGDPNIMQRTIQAGITHGVRLGAHVSYPDLAGFGRRAIPSTTEEVINWCLYQFGSLYAMALASGVRVEYVKPHGALYHRLHQDLHTLQQLCASMRQWPGHPSIMLLAGPAGAKARAVADQEGLHVIREAFVDRAYEADGRLRSRQLSGAVLSDWDQIETQARGILNGHLILHDGEGLALEADTLCVHSDSSGAVGMLSRLKSWI